MPLSSTTDLTVTELDTPHVLALRVAMFTGMPLAPDEPKSDAYLERQKGRNMSATPKVALLVIDPKNSSRWIEVRGNVAEIWRAGAEAHVHLLTPRYTGKQRFYGDVYPVKQKLEETRVIGSIEPMKVSLDAIFKGRRARGISPS